MAGYRQFHTQFWKDEWLIDLSPLERYLFTYLFTNELSSISGIYKIPKRVISNETGLDMLVVDAALLKFEQAQKVLYRDGVMWVVNMAKFHDNASPLTQKKVLADVEKIPDGIVKRAYLYHKKTGKYSIDTVSILNSENKSESKIENKNEKEAGGVPVEELDEDSAITKLSKQFEVSAQLMPYDNEKWLTAIREMFHGGVTPEILGEVVNNMRNPEGRGKKLTITGPWSCTRMAIARAAELKSTPALIPVNGKKQDADMSWLGD